MVVGGGRRGDDAIDRDHCVRVAVVVVVATTPVDLFDLDQNQKSPPGARGGAKKAILSPGGGMTENN